MRRLLVVFGLAFLVSLMSSAMPEAMAQAEVVHGYIKKDGTFVAPHLRSKADNTELNNRSYKPGAKPKVAKKSTKKSTTAKSSTKSNTKTAAVKKTSTKKKTS
ncbi:MAG: hypothetical protein HY246_23955 [Proteobacteria bacterium]|nr:hypothetical protein [Pseudomonadota bacterium]